MIKNIVAKLKGIYIAGTMISIGIVGRHYLILKHVD